MESISGDGQVVMLIEEESSVCLCRICHEEEEESTTDMEIPCACSGTLKFAHRGCIQRWCDEKGSATCEICLQKFEPGYRVSPKKAIVDIIVTIRGSLGIRNDDYDQSSSDDDEESINGVPYCSSPASRSASFCKSIVIGFTMGLLLWHLIIVSTFGTEDCAFTVFTVFTLKAMGILVPSMAVLKLISAVQKMQEQHRRRRLHASMSQAYTEESMEDRLQMEPSQTQ